MTCTNEGCLYPDDGPCLFDEVCDDLEPDKFALMALDCESIVDDEIDDDFEDGPDDGVLSPLHVISDSLHDGKHRPDDSCLCGVQARQIVAALTFEGWHFVRG